MSNTRWLAAGKKAAICFSIDDIHPGKSSDYYEAGGDCERGALGHLSWLQQRHPKLKTTLFVTANWQQIHSYPTSVLARVPFVRESVFMAPRYKNDLMRLDRHPKFIEFLLSLPRTEFGFHGLTHCQRGLKIGAEFEKQSKEEIRKSFALMLDIFGRSGLPHCGGICPPGWAAPEALLDVLVEFGLPFVASSRDLSTAVSSDAVTAESGTHGVPLINPSFQKNGKLIHVPANFSPTCSIDRATEIIEAGGLLSIKAHVVKNCMGRISVDALANTCGYLDLLFNTLENRYGSSLWWTSMGEIAESMKPNSMLEPESTSKQELSFSMDPIKHG